MFIWAPAPALLVLWHLLAAHCEQRHHYFMESADRLVILFYYLVPIGWLRAVKAWVTDNWIKLQLVASSSVAKPTGS
jgi:hypothetical protein